MQIPRPISYIMFLRISTIVLGLGILAGSLAQAQTGQPSVVTTAVTSVSDVGAVLNGTVNPAGQSLQMQFEFGTTTNYGSWVSPTGAAVSGNVTVALTAIPYGLQPQTTYHYRLFAGNPSGVYFRGADMSFTTGAPASPPTVGTLSSYSITATTAIVAGASVRSGSSLANPSVEYGLTSAYGLESVLKPMSVNSIENLSVNLKGLMPQQTYHFRYKITNREGTVFSSDATFTTLALPTVTTGSVSDLTDLAATFNGTVDPGGALPSIYNLLVGFEWGPTTSYGNTADPTVGVIRTAGLQSISAVPSGLQPGRTYYYRIYARDDSGWKIYGTQRSFTTAPASTLPSVWDGTVSLISSTTAKVQTQVVTSGSSLTTVSCEYGLTEAYGSETFLSALPWNTSSAVSGLLQGLTPETTYHFRVKALNTEGIATSPDASFTTAASPVAVTNAATGVGNSGAALNGTVSGGLNLALSFELGTTVNYGSSVAASPATSSGSSTVVAGNVTGLLPHTTYHYRLKVVDRGNNIYFGEDQSFLTTQIGSLPTLTTGPAASVKAASVTISASQITTGDAPTTVVVECGLTTAYGMQFAAATTLLADRVYASLAVPVTGLLPGSTYHYRVKASNSSGDGFGADATFTTQPAPTLVTSIGAVTDLSANFTGLVNANSGSYTVAFEYGLTTAYGNRLDANVTSLSGTSNVSLSAALPRAQPSTTYYFRVRLSDGVSFFYGSAAQLTTLNPATLPAAVTGNASAVTATTAQLTADNVKSGSSTATITFEYGPTIAYGSAVSFANQPANRSYPSLSANLGGLQPSTTYYYRVTASNAQGTVTGAGASFSTRAWPVISAAAATAILESWADCNAVLNPSGNQANASFEYGPDTTYGSFSASRMVMGEGTYPFSTTITGLSAGTTYHYRLRLENADGIVYGPDTVFTTLPASSLPSIGPASASTTAALVTLSSTVGAGNTAAAIVFEYGPTTAYGTSVRYLPDVPAKRAMPVWVWLTGLPPNTLFHFRVRATNAAGTNDGPDGTFFTSVMNLTTGDASSVTSTTAVLNGRANLVDGVSKVVGFEYGPTANYGKIATPSPNTVTGHLESPRSVSITGLRPRTTYHYRLTGYAEGSGEDRTFVTAGAPTRPSVVTGAVAYAGADSVTISISGATGVPSPTIGMEYGLDTTYGSSQMATYSLSAEGTFGPTSVWLRGLAPATTYHCRAFVNDGTSTAYGENVTFTTSAVSLAATTLEATRVLNTSARLNGSYFSNAGTSTVSFEYGLDTNYGTTVTGPRTGSTLSVDVTGLASATTYHYRLVNTNAFGNTYGADMTFTTLADGPLAETGNASGSTSGAVTFRGMVTSAGLPVSAYIEYGLTLAYGSLVPALPVTISGASQQEVSASVTGLGFNQTYNYRILLVHAQGIVYGENATVRTADPQRATTKAATSIEVNQATMNAEWPFTGLTGYTGYFELGLTKQYGIKLLADPPGFVRFTRRTGMILQPATTYHYRFVGTSATGSAYGDDITFTTDSKPPPVLSALPIANLTATSVTLSGQVTEDGGVDALSFLFWKGAGDYGTYVNSTPTFSADTGSTLASVTLEGLQPGTTYTYRFEARRQLTSVVTTFTSSTQSFTTPTSLSPLEQWRLQYFAISGNSGNAADLAKPDQDGIPNLIKYAFLLPPGTPAVDELPTPELKSYVDGARLAVVFRRSPTRIEVTMTVEVADTPAGPWTAVGTVTNGAPCVGAGLVAETSLSPAEIQVEVRDVATTAATGKRFMRLRVAR
jgi:phosphodiesterase/alkaline phosphatase D-like protein